MNKIRNWFQSLCCAVGRHRKFAVASCEGRFYSTRDISYGYKQFHMLRLYKCSHCGDRLTWTDHKEHRVIKKDSMNWIECGVVPDHMTVFADETRMKFMETFG